MILPNVTITLTANALFTPQCNSSHSVVSGVSSITDVKDPFGSSVTPQAYVTGAATVLAWMLVLMLLITPRTFFVGGVGGGVGMLGRRGIISGSQGGSSVIGVGSRPWLQKVAALTVAISLTIATADTFRVAERQYLIGFLNAEALRAEVLGSTLIKSSRIVSDVFVWLAQVQTCIRIFPRHKTKVYIKWTGFFLVMFDATFTTMNAYFNCQPSAERLKQALTTLSYMFQLILSLTYGGCVLVYVSKKRRYAFYHPLMWNISLVAFLSIIAILTPMCFFIVDIANSSQLVWGDYFRWVGSAAASGIVWEWVERIEALEREEKKNGILGREVFEGDDSDDPEDVAESERRRRRGRRIWVGHKWRRESMPLSTALDSAPASYRHSDSEQNPALRALQLRAESQLRSRTADSQGLRPPSTNSVASPPSVSPSHRASPGIASTIQPRPTPPSGSRIGIKRPETSKSETHNPPVLSEKEVQLPKDPPESRPDEKSKSVWNPMNPFKRRNAKPPMAVQKGHVIDPVSIAEPRRMHAPHHYAPWDIKGRLGAFAADQGDRWRERSGRHQQNEEDLPVTIIPAPPRGDANHRPWSPEAASPMTLPSISTPLDLAAETAAAAEEARAVSIEVREATPGPSSRPQTGGS